MTFNAKHLLDAARIAVARAELRQELRRLREERARLVAPLNDEIAALEHALDWSAKLGKGGK